MEVNCRGCSSSPGKYSFADQLLGSVANEQICEKKQVSVNLHEKKVAKICIEHISTLQSFDGLILKIRVLILHFLVTSFSSFFEVRVIISFTFRVKFQL